MDDLGIEYSKHDNYSGRGMHNKQTHGISLKNWRQFVLAITKVSMDIGYEIGQCSDFAQQQEVLENDFNSLLEDIENSQYDQLGLGIIIY